VPADHLTKVSGAEQGLSYSLSRSALVPGGRQSQGRPSGIVFCGTRDRLLVHGLHPLGNAGH
jgi:hypothetical protein